MIQQSIKRLEYLTNIIPKILYEIDDENFSAKESENKWSKKEIIGHLIDSATNNHQRFIRGQFEENPEIKYDQNNWNKFNFYQQIEKQQLISFWTLYNKQLIEIMNRMPTENLKRTIKNGDNNLTIDFLIKDYVEHLEYHLKQVLDY